MSTDIRVLGAACDLAVVRALELVGKRVVRSERARFGTMALSGRAWHEAHTIWSPEPGVVDAALSGAWNVLPRLVNEHGCCSIVDHDLQVMLDGYVRELVLARRPHQYADLEERLHDLVG